MTVPVNLKIQLGELQKNAAASKARLLDAWKEELDGAHPLMLALAIFQANKAIGTKAEKAHWAQIDSWVKAHMTQLAVIGLGVLVEEHLGVTL